ncbi:hypothetical protein HPG69_013438, partial [Diceros bicornis minor]
LGLIPQINSLENFCSKQDLDEYQLHNCVEIASEARPQVLPGACERLIVSASARLHNGAVACKCHPQGSVGPSCSRLGGQCQCKPRVAGRCVTACHCHPQGSKSSVCDQITGQCPCYGEVVGRRCDGCLAGYFGFPNCRPCLCNGLAELCDPETGSSFNCGGFTTGRNCERCIDGYYGNHSSGQPCRPCPCPDVPSSNQYFAHSCYQNLWGSDVICSCLQGYTGKQCGECSAGFYGNPRISGAPCRPCACNNNIDVSDPESCSRVTGECLRCLHNTHGPNCQLCKPGHFGSAVNQTCRRCSCHPSGVNPAECPPDQGACVCDPYTGTCPCLPNITGQACDRCADGYWNLVTGQCPCKLGYDGKRCSECKENYYACDCNWEGTLKPACDQDTSVCLFREGVSGQQCDRCARGHSREFPACLQCHLCFDQWDHTISSLSKEVQGLMRLAATMKDKRETLPVCEADFKDLSKNMSEIERILKHPVFASGEFLKVKDYHDSVRKQILQLSEQLKTVYEFQDLKEKTVRMKNEADLLLEDLQGEIDLCSCARNASIMDSSENIKKYYQRSSSAEKEINETTSIINTLASKENLSLEKLKQIKIPDIQMLNEKVCGELGDVPCVVSSCGDPSCRGSLTLSRNALQKAQEAGSVIHNSSNQVQGLKNQIKNIRKLAEVSKNSALQLSEKVRNMKNQSESEEEKMNLLIKKLKKFLFEENVPPEDIEKVANRVLDIHLPITSQNLTHVLNKIRKLMQLCEDYRTEENRLNKAADRAQRVLVKAKVAEKAANVLLNLDKMLNKLQQVQIAQGWANSTITQLTAKITKIKKNVLQAENQAKETKNELDLAKQQSALKDGLSRLWTKLQSNRDQATRVKAQAESGQRQAGGLEEHKTSTTGLTKETLGKVKQLKDAAEKLAGDTEDKIRRITDLEKKIEDLNLSRQEKANQLKQLEDQVIALRNEIVEQENKYATCYS